MADWVIFKVFSQSTYPQLSSWDFFVSCATSCVYCSFLPLKSEGPRGDHKGGSKSSEGTSAASLPCSLQAALDGVSFICRADNSCFHCGFPLTAAATASGIYSVFSFSSQIKESVKQKLVFSLASDFHWDLTWGPRRLGTQVYTRLRALLWNSHN